MMKSAFFDRFKERLSRTRQGLLSGLSQLLNRRTLDNDALEELETRLLMADVGVEATDRLIAKLKHRVARKQLAPDDTILQVLEEEMIALLEPCQRSLSFSEQRPFVVLMVGVNGVGKTTTIGKLANRLTNEGKTVLLAAGDTFRAAAIEQLQAWGERDKIPVIAQQSGADAASVVFDAVQAGRARNIDVVIADTAGRLHTQSNLMQELEKIKRVIGKIDVNAPHEVMLVVDASTGQNALNQAVQFHQSVGLTGIVITKLDGTAKGGIVFAIAERLGIPIRFVGVGESIDDLREFNASEFVQALLEDTAT